MPLHAHASEPVAEPGADQPGVEIDLGLDLPDGGAERDVGFEKQLFDVDVEVPIAAQPDIGGGLQGGPDTVAVMGAVDDRQGAALDPVEEGVIDAGADIGVMVCWGRKCHCAVRVGGRRRTEPSGRLPATDPSSLTV